MRFMLRARLETLHVQLDRTIAASCLGEFFDLRRLLAVHQAALEAIVPALERAGAARLFPGWEGRSRLSALQADMAELRAGPPHYASITLSFPTEQEVWGALYALEGSRLGNRVLLRQVDEHGKGRERHATRYLAHCPEDGAAWPRLVVRLEALDYSGEDLETAVLGAEKVFGVYLIAAERQVLEPPLMGEASRQEGCQFRRGG
jgi:heme oxygenase